MKILCIGNSYTVDATRYLSAMAKKCGRNIETYVLYIGGCSLHTHYINALEELPLYSFFFNGTDTHIKLSIKQALVSNQYDIVTLQQASHFSFKHETYEPYTSFLFDYVKKYNPHAKLYIHQTWGYKVGSARLAAMGFATHADMYSAVAKAYDAVFSEHGFSGLLPSGKTVANLHEMGICGEATHRDDIHMSFGLGRYATGLSWLEVLTDISALECDYSEFDASVSDEHMNAAKLCAHNACEWAKQYNEN